MIRRIAFATALALAAAPVFAATTAYTLDPTHTQLVARWNHFGFSNPSAQFGTIEGTLDFDAADPVKSSVEVEIKVASINTNVAKLDEHLKGADFLDVAQFPLATFKSTKVAKGASKGELKISGDLTIHGVTKPVTLDAKINKVGEHPMRKAPAVGFDATTTIKRSDFGIGAYAPNVSDEVKIAITVEAIEANAYAKSLKQ